MSFTENGDIFSFNINALIRIEIFRFNHPAVTGVNDRRGVYACGVAGVTRARVIDIAASSGVACRVEHLPLQRVLDADELFIVNSVIGLWPISQMNTYRWQVGNVTAQILQGMKDDDVGLA